MFQENLSHGDKYQELDRIVNFSNFLECFGYKSLNYSSVSLPFFDLEFFRTKRCFLVLSF